MHSFIEMKSGIRTTNLIIVLAFLFSCYNNEFEIHESGLLYKIIEESENKASLQIGDYIELELKYQTETDSVLFNSKEFGGVFRMQINTPSHKGGSFEDALIMMNPGDRYLFKIMADSFYVHTKKENLVADFGKSMLLFDIKIIRKVTAEEIERERKLFEEQMKEQEAIILQQYIEDKEIKEKTKKSGLYYIAIKPGTGRKPNIGDSLLVHYTGSLLSGKVFDSSYERNKPFKFCLGSNEVIAGWEEGFSFMKKGGKALFIIPSELAYGKDGYSTIIPPYSSLLFEVELISIKNNN